MSPLKILVLLAAIALVGSGCSSHHHNLDAKMPTAASLTAPLCDLPSAFEVDLASTEELVITK